MARVVYSTGGNCSSCGHPIAGCRCSRPDEKKVSADGPVRVSRETKGRKGKGVTVVHGLALSTTQLRALARELKQECGSGGTVKDGAIEIQGDHRDRVVVALGERGIVARRAGG